jgi:predicted DsbA family dithiol-disulfide isomerase
MSKRIIKVDIVSDIACPWCYVGKRRFERATTSFPNVEFDVQWHPYQLDPYLPTTPIRKLEHYERKFGKERIEAYFKQHMSSVGRQEGIAFEYDGWISNTIRGHRLIEWSRQFDKQNDVVNALFQAYFEQGKDPSGIETLLDVAQGAGLDVDKTRTFLRSDGLEDEVIREAREATKKRIQGVPHFTFNGKTSLSGAQDSETFKAVIDRLIKEQEINVSSAGVCSDDSCAL